MDSGLKDCIQYVLGCLGSGPGVGIVHIFILRVLVSELGSLFGLLSVFAIGHMLQNSENKDIRKAQKTTETEGSYKTMSGIPLCWAFEPECEILMFLVNSTILYCAIL